MDVTEEKGNNVDRQTEEAVYSQDRAATTLDSLLFSEYLYTCQNSLWLGFCVLGPRTLTRKGRKKKFCA
jgi:hypothetical protein